MAQIEGKKPIKLRRGGDMHAVVVYLVGAGAYGDTWAAPEQACSSLTKSYMKAAMRRLVAKKWVAEIGDVAQVTPEGLKALEQAS